MVAETDEAELSHFRPSLTLSVIAVSDRCFQASALTNGGGTISHCSSFDDDGRVH